MAESKDKFEIKKSTLWVSLTILLGLLLVISIFTGGFGLPKKNSTGSLNIGDTLLPSDTGSAAQKVDVNIKNSYSIGKENAPVTLIEFVDFQCPFCKRFFDQTLSQIEEKYVKTGKVKFIIKDFPLDAIHPQATPAALAARCAGEQGKYFEYHDLLFQNQASLGDNLYKQLAFQLKLDTNKFDSCYSSKKYLKDIQTDQQEGISAGIQGTPGFIINSKQSISGAQPFSNFQQVIEAELSS